MIVVDKAQGMVTHPAHGNWNGTLANALLGRCRPESHRLSDRVRHRSGWPDSRSGRESCIGLDKDTSGLLIAAKDAETQDFLCAQFRDRRVLKEYLAVTSTPPPARLGPGGRPDGPGPPRPEDASRPSTAGASTP